MPSIRSNIPGDNGPTRPRGTDAYKPQPMVPQRSDVRMAGKHGQNVGGMQVGGHRNTSIFVGLDEGTAKRVHDNVENLQTAARRVFDCFNPVYDMQGDRVPHDVASVSTKLDVLKSSVEEIHRLTGAPKGQILREALYPYFERGSNGITPTEMAFMVNELDLSRMSEYGDMLSPLVDTCKHYLDKEAGHAKRSGQTADELVQSNELLGALIAVNSYQEASRMMPLDMQGAIGSGSFNTVFLTSNNTVFKPLADIAQVTTGVAGSLGIPDFNARFMERSVLASELDGLLGFGVIAKTTLARNEDSIGIEMEYVDAEDQFHEEWQELTPDEMKICQYHLGQAQWMADGLLDPSVLNNPQVKADGSIDPHVVIFNQLQASFGTDQIKRESYPDPNNPGNTLHKYSVLGLTPRKEVYDDPKVRRDLVALQLEDAISGQGDRHDGNYLVMKSKTGSGFGGVVGIDNDTSFGVAFYDCNHATNNWKNFGVMTIPYPRVVDTDMLKAINGLDENQLRATLEKRLTPDEVNSTIDRFNGLKAHLNSNKVMIIQPHMWGSDQVGMALRAEQVDAFNNSVTLSTSYYGRDMK